MRSKQTRLLFDERGKNLIVYLTFFSGIAQDSKISVQIRTIILHDPEDIRPVHQQYILLT